MQSCHKPRRRCRRCRRSTSGAGSSAMPSSAFSNVSKTCLATAHHHQHRTGPWRLALPLSSARRASCASAARSAAPAVRRNRAVLRSAAMASRSMEERMASAT
ncbi:uncharacterized protein LOC119371741 [Rhipicephalus sanguineus]|uniref:uncharacterized protein LOC119371741 n=1 Tax=Rhipicephalus sanguineus TaxID=34632 RepID=UPI001894178B|nr:uncharacterized protein LOC119371741 [Rhipicephalus sanguineus]